MLSKSEAKRLLDEMNCFVPQHADGLKRPFRIVRKLGEDEVRYCARWVSHDVQSGAIYCGRVAEYECLDRGGLKLFLCEKHACMERGCLRPTL